MKITNVWSATLLTIAALGCGSTGPESEQGGADPVGSVAHELTAASQPQYLGSTWDWSGTLELGVWRCTSLARESHHGFSCAVPDPYLLVGGGAGTEYSGAGALLTASYPSDDFSAWVGASKDHMIADPHTLRVWAFGLRLVGVSRETLAEHTFWRTETRSGNHPLVELTEDEGGDWLQISQGAVLNYQGAGSLLTRITPWSAAGKDHFEPDPATLTFFTLSIAKSIPGFGELESARAVDFAWVQSGVGSVALQTAPGYVTTGLSAQAAFSSSGRLLTHVGPPRQGGVSPFVASSKDHMVADTGTTTIGLDQLRRKVD